MTEISDSVINQFFQIKEKIAKNNNWGFNLSEENFIKGMIFLTPQSYGPRIERYIKEELSSKKVRASDNSGDIIYNGNTYEVKISILTPTNNSLNMVQIRLFHKIDYYLCIAYDLRDIYSFKKYMFLLSHDDMVKESEKASSAHGTKHVNKKNKNVELRLSFNCDENDKMFQRWKNKYMIKNYDEILRYSNV